MSLSLLTPARTVLLVTDEALYVYATGGEGARLLDAVPWGEEDFVSRVSNLLASAADGKPALILNDLVEQHYRKERVQRRGVSILDKASYVQRKLVAAFPNYPVKAGYPMKEKGVAQGKDGGADIYLFAAVPASTGFSRIIAALKDSLVSVTGFFLLPVESSDMVKTLASKVSRAAEKKNKWTVFIGQHRSGGLRQIVTKNGELALTRMTPISSNDHDAGAWAAELHQEFRATMSYLSRFGFAPEDGLNVIVIASPHVHETLQGMIDITCNLTILSMGEATRILGLSIAGHDDERCADLLHVAWTARKSSFILPMHASELEVISRPRKIAFAASVLMLISACFLGYQTLGHFSAAAMKSGEIEKLSQRKAELDIAYEETLEAQKRLGFDIQLVQSSLNVAKELARYDIDVQEIYRNLGKALGKNLRFEDVSINRVRVPFRETESQSSSRGGRNQAQNQKLEPLYEVRLRMLFPGATDIDAGNQEVRDLRDRIAASMPEHDVEVVKFLKDYEYTEQVVVNAGAVEERDVSQDFVSEIVIRGRFE